MLHRPGIALTQPGFDDGSGFRQAGLDCLAKSEVVGSRTELVSGRNAAKGMGISNQRQIDHDEQPDRCSVGTGEIDAHAVLIVPLIGEDQRFAGFSDTQRPNPFRNLNTSFQQPPI